MNKRETMTSINLKISKSLSENLSLHHIRDVVSEQTGIPIEAMESRSRKREIVFARHLYFYLAHKLTNSSSIDPKSLNTIGKLLAKDHATVLHAAKIAIPNLMDTNKAIRMRVYEVERLCELKIKLRPGGIIVRTQTEIEEYVDNNGKEKITLFSAVNDLITILPGSMAYIDAGLTVNIPEGFKAQVIPNTGVAEILEHGEHKIGLEIINTENNEIAINYLDEIGSMELFKIEKITLIVDE